MILSPLLRSMAAFVLLMGTSSPQLVTGNMVAIYAARYQVSYERMYKTIECESGFDPTIQSQYPDPSGPNGREDSWGLAQIHLPAHPSITREEALDPDFSLDFMAREFSLGHEDKWSCYKKIYG